MYRQQSGAAASRYLRGRSGRGRWVLRRQLVHCKHQLFSGQQRRGIDQQYALVDQVAADAMQVLDGPEGQGAQQEAALEAEPGVTPAQLWGLVLKHLLQVLQQYGLLQANSGRQHWGEQQLPLGEQGEI